MKFFVFMLVAISIVLILLPNIIYVAARLLGWVFHFKVGYKWFGYTALSLVALWIVLAVYGNVWGRFFHETKELTLHFDTLPKSFDGYRIVHLSDFHLDGWAGHEDRMQQIVDEVNALDADAIVFTGDLVSLSENELQSFVPVLRQLKARDGVFSILGNHDYQPYSRSWTERERAEHVAHLVEMEKEELGWKLLMNENTLVHHGSDSIAILGSENQSLGTHNIIVRGDLQKTMAGTDDLFRILLTHDPTHWRGEVLDKTDIPLTLSGHTHGGQVNVLGLFYVSTFIYKEHAGLYEQGNQKLYVNIGLGGTMPMRLGATPEITLLTLRR